MSHLRLLHGMAEPPLTKRESYWRDLAVAWQSRADSWRGYADFQIEERRKAVLAEYRWRFLFILALLGMALEAAVAWRWL